VNIPRKLTIMPGLPYHEKLAQWWGYEGDRQYIAFYWEPGADLLYADGRITASLGLWFNWLEYLRHPYVSRQVHAFDFGADDGPGTHWLLLDRREGRIFVGLAEDVHALLTVDIVERAPSKPLEVTEEEMEALAQKMRESITPVSKRDVQAVANLQHKMTKEIQAWIRSWGRV